MSGKRFNGGEIISATKLNQLVDAANAAEKTTGYNMTGSISPAGKHLSPVEGLKSPTNLTKPKDGDRIVLDSTQGTQDTDTWKYNDGDAKGKGVEIKTITDIQYNKTNITLSFRTRTLKFDKKGLLYEATGEGDLVTITQARRCSTCTSTS